jgi:hypothetical protein
MLPAPPLTPVTRFLLWDYDRMSMPYLVLSAIVLVVILAAPPLWLGDPIALIP